MVFKEWGTTYVSIYMAHKVYNTQFYTIHCSPDGSLIYTIHCSPDGYPRKIVQAEEKGCSPLLKVEPATHQQGILGIEPL